MRFQPSILKLRRFNQAKQCSCGRKESLNMAKVELLPGKTKILGQCCFRHYPELNIPLIFNDLTAYLSPKEVIFDRTSINFAFHSKIISKEDWHFYYNVRTKQILTPAQRRQLNLLQQKIFVALTEPS